MASTSTDSSASKLAPITDDRPYVGGQAVLEGVMMRSPKSLAIAVRRKDGSIVVRQDAWDPVLAKLGFLRWPLLRGSLVLIESLWNGVQALHFSAEQAAIDDQDPKKPGLLKTAIMAPVLATEAPGPGTKKTDYALVGSLALSMVLAFGLFKGLPHFLAWLTGKVAGVELGVENVAFHLLDGAFKLAIFVGYVVLIGRVDEIRRVFQYHGAEHKAINAYEHGKSLTVGDARGFTTFHARCGTSFLLFVIVMSIFVFAAVFPFVPKVSEIGIVNQLAMLALKLPLMFPIAGIAYEFNRFASRHPGSRIVQAFVSPGRLMQKLTTREPDDDQLEIALAAMRAALAREAELVKDASAAKTRIQVYAGFPEIEAAATA